jgi:2-C-methyl-D-erythritol 4-phosphate cytidylyltransferase
VPDVGVIIPAGGSGRRFGGATPKQFVSLGGIPVLARTVGLFAGRSDVAAIVVVAPAGQGKRARAIIRAAKHRTVTVVAGGKTRQQSVWNGLRALPRKCEFVLVHDAVRPFTTPGIISRVLKLARAHDAAVVGVPVGDTLRREGRAGFLAETVDRDGLWAVQTPQGFRTSLLRRAHTNAARMGIQGTDETTLVESLGVDVRIVVGSLSNLKITTKKDLEFALYLAKSRK